MGAELKCECGAGAIDVAPDLKLNELGAVSWHCSNGHLNISGSRPGFDGFQQARVETREDPRTGAWFARVVLRLAVE